MTSGAISSIQIHPIKSCHRVEVQQATVSDTGLAGDRQWQLSTGLTPTTQRQMSVLATVLPTPIEGGLRISVPGRPTIEVEQPTVTDAVTGSLIGVKVDVGDAGDEAAAWFSALIDEDVRLFGRTADSTLVIPEALDMFNQTIAFSDVAPVLVTNTASLDWLVERASEAFEMERFRPNLVVDTDEPFIEETWARFSLGAADLVHGLVWPRCPIPQIDQETGERHNEPAKVLKAHRWCSDASELAPGVRSIVENKPVFGVGCSIGAVGTVVSVGDELSVTETAAPLVAPPPAADS